MTTRLLATAAATVLTGLAAFPSSSAPQPNAPLPPAATAQTGSVHLTGFGVRGAAGAANPKLDGMLADLARHAARVRPGYELSDLRSLNPVARFTQSAPGAAPLVLIDAVTRGDPQQLKSALTALGLTGATVYANDVSGWLPVSALSSAAARAEVHTLRASLPHRRAGAVTSQGDYAQRSDVARSSNSVDGTGVTVGVLSDSYNCYQAYAAAGVAASGPAGYAPYGFLADAPTDISTGDLPASVNVLSTEDSAFCLSYQKFVPAALPFGDEGRAMLQIVHDVAPGAALAFYTAENGEADFASGIGKLAQAGAKVIADDVGYFDEPFFQDGLISQAIDTVEAQGVAYFSAAGNEGSAIGNDNKTSYETTSPSFVAASSGASSGGQLLNFAAAGATPVTSLPITIAQLQPGEPVALVVEWDQPYVTGAQGSPGASSQINVCVTGSGSDVIYNNDNEQSSCTGANAIGADPVQILLIANPATNPDNTPAENLQVTISLVSGKAPGRIKLVVEDDGAGSTINGNLSTGSPTLQGHPGAAGAAAVGAAYYFNTPRCGSSQAVLEAYSSGGGDPILFDTSGNRLATPETRQKPDFVAPDGVNNTFLGFPLSGSSGSSNAPPNTMDTSCQDMQSPSLGVYPTFSGTSAATPHAAGIAALMLQARSDATPDDIYTALRSTALPMKGQDQIPDNAEGYGFIQADAALDALGTSGSSASSSTLPVASPPLASGGGSGGGGAIDWVTLLALGGLVLLNLGTRQLRRRG